jgi:hypothetical protein
MWCFHLWLLLNIFCRGWNVLTPEIWWNRKET